MRGFVAAQPAHPLHLSTITLAEIRYGIGRLEDAARRRDTAFWLEHTLGPPFAGRTLEVSEDVVLRWRQFLPGAGDRVANGAWRGRWRTSFAPFGCGPRPALGKRPGRARPST